jgi:hypothetical protein
MTTYDMFSLDPRRGETGLDAGTTNILSNQLWNIRQLFKRANKLGATSTDGLMLRQNAQELLECACAPLDERHYRQAAKRYADDKARTQKAMLDAYIADDQPRLDRLAKSSRDRPRLVVTGKLTELFAKERRRRRRGRAACR